jgi:hypothetical protein
MATAAEYHRLVKKLTQEFKDKVSLEDKIKSALDCIELSMAEHCDQRLPR